METPTNPWYWFYMSFILYQAPEFSYEPRYFSDKK